MAETPATEAMTFDQFSHWIDARLVEARARFEQSIIENYGCVTDLDALLEFNAERQRTWRAETLAALRERLIAEGFGGPL